jgi:hypothetical protein
MVIGQTGGIVVSLKSRILALEKAQSKRRPMDVSVEELITQLQMDAVYEPAWIREQYGIVDPISEEIERELGEEDVRIEELKNAGSDNWATSPLG